MEDIFSQRVSIPRDVMVRDVAGESVILNLATETYFGLDDVGTRMWKALEDNTTVQAAYQKLLHEYDVDPETLRRDFQELIGKLVEHGLLELDSA